ncbi:DUF6468 domain-containing protein [Kordiimonas laminariae]|uniref:DUF6468 domain-containing protein n=1 Tax=Kordiimonas laminariae TaxID=2917717 RepID=UPI001FF39546|nr:DUF6468 domain-containing protein [Kordiimonas laminariae]
MTEISTLIVDGILAVLLVSVIVVCTIVYRRLGTIKSGQAELRALVDQLNTAVVDAQRSVANLKTSATEIEGRLQIEGKKASAIADELGLITEAGNNLADRIERGLSGATAAKKQQAPAETSASKKQQEEILAALREAR